MPTVARPALLDGSFHHHLLRDTARLDAFADAIARVVRPGDVVADVGSGSGILAYLALQAGAAKVHAVEANTNSYAALLRTVRDNGIAGRVVPTLADGTQWRAPEDIDVVLCELMETGLLHEPIAAVMRNVASWDATPRAIVPRRVDLQVEAVATFDTFRGYRARFPGFRAVGEGERALSDAATYATFDFMDAPPGDGVDASFTLAAREDGVVGGIQLRTRTTLVDGIELGESPAYCTPVALLLDDPIEVRAGDALVGHVAYDFDYTANPLRFDLQLKRA